MFAVCSLHSASSLCRALPTYTLVACHVLLDDRGACCSRRPAPPPRWSSQRSRRPPPWLRCVTDRLYMYPSTWCRHTSIAQFACRVLDRNAACGVWLTSACCPNRQKSSLRRSWWRSRHPPPSRLRYIASENRFHYCHRHAVQMPLCRDDVCCVEVLPACFLTSVIAVTGSRWRSRSGGAAAGAGVDAHRRARGRPGVLHLHSGPDHDFHGDDAQQMQTTFGICAQTQCLLCA